MEEIDGVCIASDVEIIKVSESFGAVEGFATHTGHQARAHRGCGASGGNGARALEDGFKYFEDGCYTLPLFVEDELALFHAAVREETDVPRAAKFLGCSCGCGGRGTGGGRVQNSVKMVSDQGLFGEEKEKRKLF